MLSQTTLQTDIKNILTDFQSNKNIDSNTAIDNFSLALSSAIDKYVRSIQVTTTIITLGSATTQTGSGIGIIS